MKFWREAASLILAVRPRQVCFNAPSASLPLGSSHSKDSSKKVDTLTGSELEDYKILMLKRDGKSSFMPSRLVFPGGVLQKVDHSTAWLDLFKKVSNSTMDDLTHELYRDGSRPPMISGARNWDVKPDIAFRICAIRETFEESGVLLTISKDQAEKRTKGDSECLQWKDSTISSADVRMLESWRKTVQKSSTEFIRMCHELEVVPNVWALHEWSNWLTPVFEKVEEASNKPNRFDTMFYLGCFDADDLPEVSSDNKETTVAEWHYPSEYLNLQSDSIPGRPKMAPPQVYELGRMKLSNHLDELNTSAAKHSLLQGNQPRLMPILKMCSDAFVMLLPGDYLYPNDPDYEGTRGESDDVKISSFAELTMNDKDKNLHRIIYKDHKLKDGMIVRQMKSSI